MISKRIDRQAKSDNYGRLAAYIAAADHDGEKSLMSWCAGCWAGDDYDLAVQEILDTQALNTRTAKAKTYHLVVSFRPEDEARLSPETFKEIEKSFAEALGLEEHQRHCGVHQNTHNIHMHIAYNLIHPEKLTRHEPFRDFHTRDRLCRALERKYSLTVDNGRNPDTSAHERRSAAAGRMEAHTGQQSFESYAKERHALILEAVVKAATWAEVHSALAAQGMEIKPHGNGLVLKDRHGKTAIKASAVDRSLSMKKLEARFGAFEAPGRDTADEPEHERYQAAPLHRGPERGALFTEYKAGIAERIARLEAAQGREDAELARIREKWARERKHLINQFLPRRSFNKLMTAARHLERAELDKACTAIRKEKETVRSDIPFASWGEFLKQRAAQGNETALAILRSKKEEFQPEKSTGRDKRAELAAKRGEIRTDFQAREREVVLAQGTKGSSRRALLSVLKMQRLATEESAGTLRPASGSTPGEKLFAGIKHSIDNKGTIIFTMPGGGTIRDTGRQIYFSAHNKAAQKAAERYAQEKWGRRIKMAGNQIVLSRQEQKRGMDR